MKKGNEGSGDLTKKEPIEFRGMGEGAIKALVGEEGLAKLKAKISEKEILDYIGGIFEAMGCKRIKNPAIPTFLPKTIPNNQRWHPTK